MTIIFLISTQFFFLLLATFWKNFNDIPFYLWILAYYYVWNFLAHNLAYVLDNYRLQQSADVECLSSSLGGAITCLLHILFTCAETEFSDHLSLILLEQAAGGPYVVLSKNLKNSAI